MRPENEGPKEKGSCEEQWVRRFGGSSSVGARVELKGFPAMLAVRMAFQDN